jgi:hypothetical protein
VRSDAVVDGFAAVGTPDTWLMPFLLRATPQLDPADWSLRSEVNLTVTGHSRDTPDQTHNATETPQRLAPHPPSGHYALVHLRTAAVIALLFVTACDSDSTGSVTTLTEVTDVLPQLAADSGRLITQREVDPQVGAPSLPPQQPRRVDVNIHCGVAWLSRQINGMWWHADEAPTEMDWWPDEWRSAFDLEQQEVEVEVELSADGTVLVASLNGREVIYKPVPPDEFDAWCA